jgi:hypothetical protein
MPNLIHCFTSLRINGVRIQSLLSETFLLRVFLFIFLCKSTDIWFLLTEFQG